jgi:hypothetical protein
MKWSEKLHQGNCQILKLSLGSRLIIVFAALLFGRNGFCQLNLNSTEVDEIIGRSAKFIVELQSNENSEGGAYKGEWPAYMQMRKAFVLLGTRSLYYDSNAFTTLAIHNSLAESVLTDSTLNYLKPALNSAYECAQAFQSEGQYNFWRLLEPNRPDLLGDSARVRRPSHFKLGSGFINNAANVVNDADDTSAGELAEFYQFKMGLIESNPKSRNTYNQVYLNYTDTNRCNLHWFNFIKDGNRHYGAYLTWLGQEKCIGKRFYLPRILANNFIFFLPKSICYPEPGKPYIPYGANDLDAVVNCNVLLARSIKIADEGMSRSDSCAVAYITQKIKRKKWSTAGIYYPNRYAIHYFVSRAYRSGIKDLGEARNRCLSHLVKTQNSNGSYTGRNRVNQGDPVQNTVYAALALLNMADPASQEHKAALDQAMRYLLLSVNTDSQSRSYWNAGVYFSGGTVVRNNLFFQSESLTTALVLEALVKYRAKYM